MGQGLIAGVMYGAIIPKSVSLWNEEAPGGSIMEAWKERVRNEIQAPLRNDEEPWGPKQLESWRRLVPKHSNESTPEHVGFWIAINDGFLANERGCKEIGRTTLVLSKLERKLAAEIADAKARWDAFAAFCRERGANLKGELLLATDWD